MGRVEQMPTPIQQISETGPRGLTERLRGIRTRPWPYFGGLAMVCFGLQVVTGLIMAFVYQPTPDNAYVSSYYIANVMPYGWLVRTIHAWGAHLTIVFAALHAVRIFVSASYKPPRQANWVIGVVGLLTVIAMGFTGNLLPWDQKAYWNTDVTVSLFREAPFFGKQVATLILGGDSVGSATLTRFFAAHVTILPAALVGLLVAHMWLARRARRIDLAARIDTGEADSVTDETSPLLPDVLISAATSVVLLFSLYAVLAILVPATLEAKADALDVPAVSKPAWYFLSLYTLSKYLKPSHAAAMTVVLGLLFIFLPYLDKGASVSARDRIFALSLGFTVIAGVLALTVAGVSL